MKMYKITIMKGCSESMTFKWRKFKPVSKLIWTLFQSSILMN